MTDAIHIFFQNGCQYYVAGRYAAFAALNPVAGNLMHHAIEHLLKGGLSETKTLSELKKLMHNLPSIWETFKAQANDPALARFDDVISGLHDIGKFARFQGKVERLFPRVLGKPPRHCSYNHAEGGSLGR